MKVIKKDEILVATIKTKRDEFCTKCNKDAVKKVVSDVKEFDAVPLDKVKQAREDIEQLKHEHTDVEGYRWWNNAIANCLHELDKLIAESEGVNENNN